MPVRTKRWNDEASPDDGFRVLVTRYRPRGLKREDETWDVWLKELGPSTELHADAYGKRGREITFDEYRLRYLREISGQDALLDSLARRVREGETVTLLCSSACVDPQRCHRTILASLLLERQRTA